MTKKFEAKFDSPTPLSPSFVYVSPSAAYEGMFAVGILYTESSSGSFQSASGIVKNFDFKQNLFRTEDDATAWAMTWLAENFKCSVTLKEVSIEEDQVEGT